MKYMYDLANIQVFPQTMRSKTKRKLNQQDKVYSDAQRESETSKARFILMLKEKSETSKKPFEQPVKKMLIIMCK